MKKRRFYDDLFRGVIVILSSTLYSLGVLWFLEPAGLISIGLSGLGQILNRAFLLINVDIPVGVFVFVFNIPLCIYGAKTVSPRFVIFTIISVLVQSFWLMGWDWAVIDFGFNPNDRFFLSVIGGLMAGGAIGLALRYGTSTGGVDIIAQSLALRKNISIGVFSMVVNVILAIIGGGLMQNSWAITLYTFIFIVISNLAVDKIHTAYNYVRIDVISTHAEAISTALLEGIKRGCTISDVRGAYTKEPKSDVFMIISSYEVQKAAEIIMATDPGAFMTVSPIKRIFGKFFKHTII